MKPYPSYKPSGVPWLGEVPAHWGLKRLKFHVDQVGEKTSEPLAGAAYIGLEHIESGTGKFISSLEGTQTESESTVSHFRVGDVLFGKLRPYLAKAVIAYGNGVCTTELLVLRPHSMDSGYLLNSLLLDGFIKTVDASTVGAKMPRADWTFIGNLLLPDPPVAEQQAIAAYLDTEAARIDTLIAEKGRLIDSLREYRQATIDSALARGLKEGVTIVSTKQAWWGSIPQHWALLPLKRIVGIRITDGPHETPELVEQGVPFVSAEAIKGGRVDFNQRRGNITPELHEIFCKKARPRRGDVFVVKSGATTGNVGFVDTDDEFSIWSPLALVRYFDGYSDGRYLFWAMSSNAFRLAVRMHWSAGTQPNLGMAVLENLSIPVPPFDEQRAIAAYLDRETTRIDKLIEHVRDEIKLLQELRAATITDAVTGKIQVS